MPVSIRDFSDAMEITDLQGIMSRLIGCNFMANAATLRDLGGFDERLGAGSRAMSAEDFDLFYRMLRARLRLAYEPAIELFHAHGRRTKEQLIGLTRAYMLGRGAWYAKQAMRGDRTAVRGAYWELRGLASDMRRQYRQPPSAGNGALSPAKGMAALARGAFLRLSEGGRPKVFSTSGAFRKSRRWHKVK